MFHPSFDAVIVLAVDDTAHRRGKHVHGVSWIHDGSAPSRNELAFGHRWIIAGVIVHLPLLTRPVCLPVVWRRWQGKGADSPMDLACHLIEAITAPTVHVVADAAHHGRQVRTLPARVTWTTRLPECGPVLRPSGRG